MGFSLPDWMSAHKPIDKGTRMKMTELKTWMGNLSHPYIHDGRGFYHARRLFYEDVLTKQALGLA